MNGVKRPNRLEWERTPGPMHDLRIHAMERPVCGRRIDDGTQTRRFGRSQTSSDCGPTKCPIAFDESQVGGMDRIGSRESRTGLIAEFFVEEPSYDCARFRV